MTKSPRTSAMVTAAALALVGFLAPRPAAGQLPRDPVERARVIKEILQTNARQLTLFDRSGKPVGQIGPRAMYNRPVLSPDGKRVAVVMGDLDKETNDVWVLDVATGQGTQITRTQPREPASTPVWSPDGSQVAYVRLTDGFPALYRKASTGAGAEELLYKHTAPMDLTDWSMDGRYLSFFSTNLGGGALYSVPLEGTGERKPIEILRSTFQLRAPRLSPDGRFVVYVSNPSGRDEIYVRPFDPSGAQSPAEPWQVSKDGGIGMPIGGATEKSSTTWRERRHHGRRRDDDTGLQGQYHRECSSGSRTRRLSRQERPMSAATGTESSLRYRRRNSCR